MSALACGGRVDQASPHRRGDLVRANRGLCRNPSGDRWHRERDGGRGGEGGLHAVVGGAVSVAQDGSFETGALTGAVAAGSSLLMDSSGVMGHSGDGNPEYIAERTFNRRKRRYGSGARK